MIRYNYDVNLPRQERFIKRFKKLLIFLVICIVIAGVLVGMDIWRLQSQKSPEGTATTNVIRPNISEFETSYFDFTAPTSWRSITKETTTNKYVYRSTRYNLVEQELTIYIGDIPTDLAATRVLGIRVDSERNLIPSEVSAPCGTSLPASAPRNPTMVTVFQTRFLCSVDGTNYLVVVGEKGGSTQIKLRRPNGTMQVYGFVYRNSTVHPDPKQLPDIINSFHTR